MTNHPCTIVVIGGGYVGLVTAAGLATVGHRIRLVETAPHRLAALRTGRIPLHEDYRTVGSPDPRPVIGERGG